MTWRAWLGTGDADRMDQLGVAEFGTAEDARAWVERRLVSAGASSGKAVFGSVDRGSYVCYHGHTRWEPDPFAGSDADLVDGRVSWRTPGGC